MVCWTVNVQLQGQMVNELLKKIGKVMTSKSIGNEPSTYEKINLPGHGRTEGWETLA